MGNLRRVAAATNPALNSSASTSVSASYQSTSLQRATTMSNATSKHTDKQAPSSKTRPVDSKGKKSPKSRPTTVCCTAPLLGLFGVGCVVIAAVFTVITVYSSLTFTDEVESSVRRFVSNSMQSAMNYITNPLQQSHQYASKLKTMLEANPDRFLCDDSAVFPGTNSTQNFFYETGMYALQRTSLFVIFQSRYSTRFLRPNGGGPAGVSCMMGPSRHQLFLMANNTQYTGAYSNGSYFANIGSQVSSAPIALAAKTVNGTTWSLNTVQGLGYDANKYTITVHVNDPTDPTIPWVVGIDHILSDLVKTLLQATPPNRVGDTSTPIQTAGAHTTLYDLNSGLCMSSTSPDVPSAKSQGVLFASGDTPSSDVNDAYREGIQTCGSDGCTTAMVVLGDKHIRTFFRMQETSVGLNLLMVSSVPRSLFFTDADKTFAVTLGLSISCCVAVVAGCVALLVLIHRPLTSLKVNMVEAAELHNDTVEHTSTYVREIALLSAVFDQMNQQLLVARSFVPEAVLLGKSSDSNDDEDGDDEGSAVGTVTRCSASVGRTSSRAAAEITPVEFLGTTTGGSSNSTEGAGGMSKLFNIAEKRLGVLSLNLVGFHALCQPERGGATRAQKIHDISTALLTAAVGCAHGERGVMDSFHGDHFTITFNASRAVAGPLAAAVRTASAFISEIRRGDSCNTFKGAIGVAAGAASGRAHVGTFGIEGYRRMSVVGDVYRTASLLQSSAVQCLRMNADVHLEEGCLVEEQAIKELGSCAIHLQAVGCVQTSALRSTTNTKALPHAVYMAHVADVGSEGRAAGVEADGEWLYELDAMEVADPFSDPNRAMAALIDGDYALCGRLLQDANIHDTNEGGNNQGALGDDPLHGSCDDDSTSPTTTAVIVSINPSKVSHHRTEQAWRLVLKGYTEVATERPTSSSPVDSQLHKVAFAKKFTVPFVFFQQ